MQIKYKHIIRDKDILTSPINHLLLSCQQHKKIVRIKTLNQIFPMRDKYVGLTTIS